MAITYGTFQYGGGYYGGDYIIATPPNKITCNNYEYTGGNILFGNCHMEKSLAGDELSIDTLDTMLRVEPAALTTSDKKEFRLKDGSAFMCANPIDRYAYGDSIEYRYNNGLIGKFYVEKTVRKGKAKFEFSGISAIGLLDNTTHYGGIYTETPAETIISEIMGDIPYTIYSDVSTVPMSGWLPKATSRENLQQVLFAIGAGVFKDSGGNIVIRFVESSTPVTIENDRIYADGNVDYGTPATRVDVTEHAFSALSSDSLKTLLDTSENVTSQIVIFDNPCHDLVATGLTIESSGVNYAIVSGIGTLTGKEYTHTKKVITYDTGVAGTPNIVTVTDATLVSTFNSYNVAQRVAQYYSAVSTDSIGLVVGDERPATEVSFMDAFSDLVSGYIKSMDINMSATLKADTDIAIGFLPTGHGNNFNNYVLLTGSGTWTVPAGIKRIFVILVEGGHGGAGGTKGSGGEDGNGKHGGAGGTGGVGGTSGLIFMTNLTVTPSSGYQYSCGIGGAGGAQSANGQPGSATTLGTYSSASGKNFPAGYVEPKTKYTFAGNGETGNAGGKGTDLFQSGTSITYNGITYYSGANGATAFGQGNYSRSYAYGGAGGGAAVGNNGVDGENAYVYAGTEYPDIVGEPFPGKGGNGADALAREPASNYGAGGHGGHGGGGGGAGGYMKNLDSPNTLEAFGGKGGSGSSGGKGGDGCIVIYY